MTPVHSATLAVLELTAAATAVSLMFVTRPLRQRGRRRLAAWVAFAAAVLFGVTFACCVELILRAAAS